MPSLVPQDSHFDVTVHIVLEDYGRLGRTYRETDEVDADEPGLINDILTGQFEHIVRIVAFNTDQGWSRDVTEDIARKVVDEAQRRGRDIRDGARKLVARFMPDAVET